MEETTYLKQGSGKYVPWVGGPSLHIKFYWNIAELIHLRMYCPWLLLYNLWQLRSRDRERMATSPRYLLSGKGKFANSPLQNIHISKFKEESVQIQ